jgi:hypothetical protein
MVNERQATNTCPGETFRRESPNTTHTGNQNMGFLQADKALLAKK